MLPVSSTKPCSIAVAAIRASHTSILRGGNLRPPSLGQFADLHMLNDDCGHVYPFQLVVINPIILCALLARDAKAAGLLTEQELERLVREALRARSL